MSILAFLMIHEQLMYIAKSLNKFKMTTPALYARQCSQARFQKNEFVSEGNQPTFEVLAAGGFNTWKHFIEVREVKRICMGTFSSPNQKLT